MIKELKLENFKSFINKQINFAPLTVLTGINASGKSSVIQAIRMVYKANINQAIQLKNHALPASLKSKLTRNDNIKLEVLDFTNNKESNYSLSLEKNDNGTYFYNPPAPSADISDISYISSGRYGPENELPFYNMDVPRNVGEKGEYVIAFIEANENFKVPESLRVNNNTSDSGMLKNCINNWLNEITPNSNLSYDKKNDVLGRFYPTYNGIVPTETGFGLSSTLPIIASLLFTQNKKEVLIIENPETHLHPAAQTKMGELIALSVAAGKQVIIETHSDHIIDGIRIAAKQNKIKAEDVMFHFFKRDSFETETSIESPELLQDGKLSFWPEGFFDQSMINMEELLN